MFLQEYKKHPFLSYFFGEDHSDAGSLTRAFRGGYSEAK